MVAYFFGNKDADKKILLVHGWSGSGTQMSFIVEELLTAGYGVVRFDATGNGKSYLDGKLDRIWITIPKLLRQPKFPFPHWLYII